NAGSGVWPSELETVVLCARLCREYWFGCHDGVDDDLSVGLRGAELQDARDLRLTQEAGMARPGPTDERRARVRLFDGLSRRQLERISRLMTSVELSTGKVLARQGEIGREFVILVDGEVEVARDGKVIAVRGPGDYIGEIALLDDRPR